jgi:hypothetical protein
MVKEKVKIFEIYVEDEIYERGNLLTTELKMSPEKEKNK